MTQHVAIGYVEGCHVAASAVGLSRCGPLARPDHNLEVCGAVTCLACMCACARAPSVRVWCECVRTYSVRVCGVRGVRALRVVNALCMRLPV
jgi:hypothetical protein